jgi:hypothetical protein
VTALVVGCAGLAPPGPQRPAPNLAAFVPTPIEVVERMLQLGEVTVDIASATVVTLYLSRNANLLLRPKLQRELRRGARVVSHAHDMGDWWPERVERVRARSGEKHILYLWRIATEGRHRGRASPTALRGIPSGEE